MGNVRPRKLYMKQKSHCWQQKRSRDTLGSPNGLSKTDIRTINMPSSTGTARRLLHSATTCGGLGIMVKWKGKTTSWSGPSRAGPRSTKVAPNAACFALKRKLQLHYVIQMNFLITVQNFWASAHTLLTFNYNTTFEPLYLRRGQHCSFFIKYPWDFSHSSGNCFTRNYWLIDCLFSCNVVPKCLTHSLCFLYFTDKIMYLVTWRLCSV